MNEIDDSKSSNPKKTSSEKDFESLYGWIDSISFSRQKKNISRDFSDGVLMAELISKYYPKLVQVHNYIPANSTEKKLYNWNTLRRKVFKKLGFQISEDEIQGIVISKSGIIQETLFRFKEYVDNNTYKKKRKKKKEQKKKKEVIYDNVHVQDTQKNYNIKKKSKKKKRNLENVDEEIKERTIVELEQDLIIEKDQKIQELQETISLLEKKCFKLENLVKLKDTWGIFINEIEYFELKIEYEVYIELLKKRIEWLMNKFRFNITNDVEKEEKNILKWSLDLETAEMIDDYPLNRTIFKDKNSEKESDTLTMINSIEITDGDIIASSPEIFSDIEQSYREFNHKKMKDLTKKFKEKISSDRICKKKYENWRELYKRLIKLNSKSIKNVNDKISTLETLKNDKDIFIFDQNTESGCYSDDLQNEIDDLKKKLIQFKNKDESIKKSIKMIKNFKNQKEDLKLSFYKKTLELFSQFQNLNVNSRNLQQSIMEVFLKKFEVGTDEIVTLATNIMNVGRLKEDEIEDFKLIKKYFIETKELLKYITFGIKNGKEKKKGYNISNFLNDISVFKSKASQVRMNLKKEKHLLRVMSLALSKEEPSYKNKINFVPYKSSTSKYEYKHSVTKYNASTYGFGKKSFGGNIPEKLYSDLFKEIFKIYEGLKLLKEKFPMIQPYEKLFCKELFNRVEFNKLFQKHFNFVDSFQTRFNNFQSFRKEFKKIIKKFAECYEDMNDKSEKKKTLVNKLNLKTKIAHIKRLKNISFPGDINIMDRKRNFRSRRQSSCILATNEHKEEDVKQFNVVMNNLQKMVKSDYSNLKNLMLFQKVIHKENYISTQIKTLMKLNNEHAILKKEMELNFEELTHILFIEKVFDDECAAIKDGVMSIYQQVNKLEEDLSELRNVEFTKSKSMRTIMQMWSKYKKKLNHHMKNIKELKELNQYYYVVREEKITEKIVGVDGEASKPKSIHNSPLKRTRKKIAKRMEKRKTIAVESFNIYSDEIQKQIQNEDKKNNKKMKKMKKKKKGFVKKMVEALKSSIGSVYSEGSIDEERNSQIKMPKSIKKDNVIIFFGLVDVHGIKNGKGKEFYGNNGKLRFYGEYKFDQKHGYGIYTDTCGEIIRQGIWRFGVFTEFFFDIDSYVLKEDIKLKKLFKKKQKVEISSGASGTIFQLKGTDLAFKQVNLYQQNEIEFVNECKIMTNLNHTNIVKFFTIIYSDNNKKPIGLIEEFCENGDIKTLIKKTSMNKQKIPWAFKQKILLETAAGMKYLHSKRIIHYDMKWDNVLLNKINQVKITDFGLSHKVESLFDKEKHQFKKGTVVYIAPEVARRGKLDEKCDVFSFGIMMFELFVQTTNPYQRDFKKDFEDGFQLDLVVSVDPKFRPKIENFKMDSKDIEKFQWWIDLMKKCWDEDPTKRPDFDKIEKTIFDNLPKYNSFDTGEEERVDTHEQLNTPISITDSISMTDSISIDLYSEKSEPDTMLFDSIKSDLKNPSSLKDSL